MSNRRLGENGAADVRIVCRRGAPEVHNCDLLSDQILASGLDYRPSMSVKWLRTGMSGAMSIEIDMEIKDRIEVAAFIDLLNAWLPRFGMADRVEAFGADYIEPEGQTVVLRLEPEAIESGDGDDEITDRMIFSDSTTRRNRDVSEARFSVEIQPFEVTGLGAFLGFFAETDEKHGLPLVILVASLLSKLMRSPLIDRSQVLGLGNRVWGEHVLRQAWAPGASIEDLCATNRESARSPLGDE